MWVHLKTSFKEYKASYYEAIAEVIMLGRRQSLTYFGKEPDILAQPYNVEQNEWLKQHSDARLLKLALLDR